MNAPLLPEVFTRIATTPQADLPLATEGVLRHIWESRFGAILIEVREGKTFVNGQLVEPAEPGPDACRLGP